MITMGPSAQATLYPFVLIGSILHGSICAHQGNDGLIMLIGSILHEQCCGHSFSLAVLFMEQQWVNSRSSAVSYGQEWAHLCSLVVFCRGCNLCSLTISFMGKNGPIHAHRQYSSGTIIGPFMLISSILHGQCCAHSCSSTVFFMDNDGPIHAHWQFFHGQHWAHLCSLTVSLIGKNGPIHSPWQFSPLVTMGPFVLVGSLLHGQQWAHSCSLAACSWTKLGPFMLYHAKILTFIPPNRQGLELICQELDSSWLLGVSKTVMLWKQEFSGTMVKESEESTKLKLDRRWEESGLSRNRRIQDWV